MKLPVRLISLALRSPTVCGRNTLSPPPVVTPADEVRGRAAELAEVETGAERGVDAGEDDDIDAVVRFGTGEGDGEGSLQLGVHGVAGVGAVERDRADARGGLGENRFVHRGDTSNASPHEHSRAPGGRYSPCV